MFKHIGDRNSLINIELDNQLVAVPEGISVAAALYYLNRIEIGLHPLSAQPRAAYCLMGVCFECLVEIDGLSGQRACQVLVREGIVIRTQQESS